MTVDDVASALQLERARALTRIEALSRELASVIDSAQDVTLDDEHDPDGSTVGFERAQLTALLHQARADLAALDRAIERSAAGTYGVCTECGNVIAPERLMAIPATTTCVQCAGGNRRRR